MKMLIEETKGECLDAFFGKRITLFCGVYVYTGKLVGVNDTCVKLEDAAIVYETGPFTDAKWKDAQSPPGEWYVARQATTPFCDCSAPAARGARHGGTLAR